MKHRLSGKYNLIRLVSPEKTMPGALSASQLKNQLRGFEKQPMRLSYSGNTRLICDPTQQRDHKSPPMSPTLRLRLFPLKQHLKIRLLS